MTKASYALAISAVAIGLSATGYIAHADPAPATGTASAPAVPEQYRSAIAEAGKTCAQVDGPLIAAVLSVETGFQADRVSPAGMVSAGQLPPQVWKQFARPGEEPTDAAAGTRVTARYLCSLAGDVDKFATGATAEGKAAFLLTTYSAGQGFAQRVRDGAALADPSTPQILTETAPYVARVLAARDEYRKQGI